MLFGEEDEARRIRLTGFDAPELDGACPAEREAALKAKRALHEWLARRPFEWNGGADPPRDRYGRELRRARRGPDELADAMIGRGLAVRGGRGAPVAGWCD
jgi:endonuclease YncB( thermonuclease family)